MSVLTEILAGLIVLVVFAGLLAGVVWLVWMGQKKRSLAHLLKRHFQPTPLDRISVTERQFPMHIRADLQSAVNEFIRGVTVCSFTGVKSEGGFGGASISSLLNESLIRLSGASAAAPPQYEHIDVGEAEPIRALQSGLWLLRRNGAKFAILYAPVADFGECGISHRVRLEVATAEDEQGTRIAQEFYAYLEAAVLKATCYRGKVLSLEAESSYFGQASGVKVHRLSRVERDAVILPAETVDLLDRNVIQFVERRRGLGDLQMATKKGLLFYGPPGTGKTHTIRYLAGSLEGHTTFLISAEQVGLLGEYMTLARLFQPSLVVIEDVDLIARERTTMHNPTAEVLLNKLLNEMDGLREDCEILFVLTTNRPELLEAALSSRPGRIDQAIEFPLPDLECRTRLVQLYSRGLVVPRGLVTEIAKRTEKVSASFIKELMRRAAQFYLQRGRSGAVDLVDVECALDEMLFSGGSLNLKLLGAEQRIQDTPDAPAP